MTTKMAAGVSFIAVAVFAGIARAEWSNAGPVTQIQYNRNSYEAGDVFIFLDNVSCSATNSHFRIRRSDTIEQDMDGMLRLLIASRLAERPVRLGFSRHDGSCLVYAVKL
jgi:hypothetical protein